MATGRTLRVEIKEKMISIRSRGFILHLIPSSWTWFVCQNCKTQVWASKVEASFAGSGTAARELELEAQSKRLRFPSADRYMVTRHVKTIKSVQ